MLQGHRDGCGMELRVEARAGVLDQHAVEAAVVGFSNEGVDADVGGDARDQQVVDIRTVDDIPDEVIPPVLPTRDHPVI